MLFKGKGGGCEEGNLALMFTTKQGTSPENNYACTEFENKKI